MSHKICKNSCVRLYFQRSMRWLIRFLFVWQDTLLKSEWKYLHSKNHFTRTIFSNGTIHIRYRSCGSKTEEINQTVHTNGLFATWLDGSKICRPIFDLCMGTVPDKWLVVYRNQCQHSHRWYYDWQNHRPHPFFWVYSDQICVILLTFECGVIIFKYILEYVAFASLLNGEGIWQNINFSSKNRNLKKLHEFY